MTFRKEKSGSELMLGATSPGLLRQYTLNLLLDRSITPLKYGVSGVIGWGKKRNTAAARSYSNRNNLKYIALEDGFLRSYGTGDEFPTLSIVYDDEGIYYDSTHPSLLENLLNKDTDLMSDTLENFQHALELIREHCLSKYNHTPMYINFTQEHSGRVLVIDQTVGDMSIKLGHSNAQTFRKMLDAARSENPKATIFVKSHPEVASGRKKGYLTGVQPNERTVVLTEAVSPISLLNQMDKIYVVTSTMGFEALLAGKPVVCFGVPWYAGWGVTDDRCVDSQAWARRTRRRTVDELFVAAYIHHTRYLNPVTHERGTILHVIDWLVRQKEMAFRMHGAKHTGRVIGVGFRRWKANNLKPLLGLHNELVGFVKNLKNLKVQRLNSCDSVVCWGATPPDCVADYTSSISARLFHIEDGFIRSVGLGSDMIRPQSIVLDERGIYFDATRPSDLEVLLNERKFTADDLTRAQAVRSFILEHDITKYNLETRQSVSWLSLSQGKSIILVPGQVEDDASITLGCTTVNNNLDLLKRVRFFNPNAFIVFKPHPDVSSGNRKGRIALNSALKYADFIETKASVVSCIECCDEVHTMTSLTGFDALLRKKRVVTYGQPFYAGWGLTEDMAENATAFSRRQRRLTLDELVAGALLHYPIYWDWDLKGYTTCEAVLHRIVEERSKLEANGGLEKLRVGYLRRQLRKLKVLVRSSLE